MATHTLGTTSTTALNCVAFNPSPNVLAPADAASISQSITGDERSGAFPQGGNSAANGILATGTTHSTTTLDTLVSTGGGPLAAIQVGMLVLGVGIAPGTFVAQVLSGTSVLLSKAATASAAGVRILFSPLLVSSEAGMQYGLLTLPNGRGTIKLFPGDVIAVDNTGWPIVVSGNSIAYAGTLWSFI